MKMIAPKKWGVFGLWFCVLFIVICMGFCDGGRSEKEVRERFYGNMPNSSSVESSDGSLAKMFDRVLEKEFSENEQPEGFYFLLFHIHFLSIWLWRIKHRAQK